MWAALTFVGLLCEAQYNVKQSSNVPLYFAHLYKESTELGVGQKLFIARNPNFDLRTMALRSYETPCEAAFAAIRNNANDKPGKMYCIVKMISSYNCCLLIVRLPQ